MRSTIAVIAVCLLLTSTICSVVQATGHNCWDSCTQAQSKCNEGCKHQSCFNECSKDQTWCINKCNDKSHSAAEKSQNCFQTCNTLGQTRGAQCQKDMDNAQGCWSKCKDQECNDRCNQVINKLQGCWSTCQKAQDSCNNRCQMITA